MVFARTHLFVLRKSVLFQGVQKQMQNVQTEPQGNPKLYKGTARGEVWTEFRETVCAVSRRAKMVADEERRRRQYKGTARSRDEVSKGNEIKRLSLNCESQHINLK